MSHEGDEMSVNGAEGVDLASQSVVVVQPSSVAEPEDRLVAQSPPPPMPMSVAAGPSGVQGGAAPVLSVLHLHRHEHTEGVVDQEARAVVDRLATQHGELFQYLHQEIESLKKDMVREQFAEEVETWAGKVQGEMERQGRELETLRTDMEASTSGLSKKLAQFKKDMDLDLLQVRALIKETQKQLNKTLEVFDSRLGTLTGKWGDDINRLLNMSKETNVAVDKRLSQLIEKSDSEYARLQEQIAETAQQQTILMTAIESMEDQLAQVPVSARGSADPCSPEPVCLPSTLFGEDADPQPSRPIVGDSVTSPVHPVSMEGPKLSLSPAMSPIKVRVQGTAPEYTSESQAVPAIRMVSHMVPEDTHPQAAGTSGVSGTQGGAVMGVGVGQMKLDAPPRYGGGRKPGARVWLSQMERYMRLMKYPRNDWLDVVAMRVEGAASSWMNATLLSIERGQRVRFIDWDDFRRP